MVFYIIFACIEIWVTISGKEQTEMEKCWEFRIQKFVVLKVWKTEMEMPKVQETEMKYENDRMRQSVYTDNDSDVGYMTFSL